MMKAVLVLLSMSFVTGFAFNAEAVTCNQIREKAKSKKGKAVCILIDHTTGIQIGSSVSVYQCGGTKYTLTQQEDSSCTVSPKK